MRKNRSGKLTKEMKETTKNLKECGERKKKGSGRHSSYEGKN
jgi:hypothetical protein